MHKVSAKHHVLGRSVAELEERDPSLINLPLPANSIPVVGQLASPLLGNGADGGAQPSTLPPQPAPISTPGNGGGGGNGGGSGNGGANGNGGGDGNGGGNGNGGGSGNGGGGGNGGGSQPTPTASPTSGGGTPVSIVPSPTSPNSAPGNSSSSGAKNASGGGSAASLSSTGGGQIAPINVGSGPSTNPAALAASSPAALATGFLSPSQPLLGSGSNTAALLPTISTAGAVSSGKQLSGGAIAGITIACLLFLLAFVLLVVRHRSIARRVELRRQWWFSRRGHNLSLVGSGNSRSPVGLNGEVPASRLSARSSFATNFDQGLMFRIDSPSGFSLGLALDLPPTAEVRERNSALISTGASVARRESMNSMLSNGSDPGAQYLAVSTGENNLEPSSSMSVRPFSPSESFAFPKPPAPPSSTVDSFFISGTPGPASPQSSATTLVHLSTPPRAFMTDLPPASVSTSPYPQLAIPSSTLLPAIAAVNPSMDPFADPAKPEFSDVEVIRRPFTPSLDDELAVRPGDRVHIFRIFDDGWAFVERLAGTERERHERGLIPVDCFREVDQAFPTFLSEKRVSYGSDKLIATAL